MPFGTLEITSLILNKNSFELGQTDMCKYLKMIAGYKFVYIQQGNDHNLFCFNGRFWENNDVIFKNCLSTDLYDFLKTILIEVYWNHPEFKNIKSHKGVPYSNGEIYRLTSLANLQSRI